MTRRKQRPIILHSPSTQEIFNCLSSMPSYSKILLDNGVKPYSDFLDWLLKQNFFNTDEDRVVIKKIAADYGIASEKVTKWLKQIYEDIFELNDSKPDLFQGSDNISVTLSFHNHDNWGTFNTSLTVVPREFETFYFHFMQAKLGIQFFWVKKVEHKIENDKPTVSIYLDGGFVNRYREFIIDKALFQGEIGLMDEFNMSSYELDDKLRKIYRS